MRISLLIFFCFLHLPVFGQHIEAEMPTDIDPGKVYIIYSHGRIVEGENPRPIHPSWGTYLFPEIQEALVQDNDWILISEHRPFDADINEYAQKIAHWVEQLITAGVPSHHITLIGFSKGGHITARTSHLVSQYEVNTILLATCGEWIEAETRLKGHVLSIYETSDLVGSCDALASRSTELRSYTEIAISTGLQHGAFFSPRDAWLTPLKDWIHQELLRAY